MHCHHQHLAHSSSHVHPIFSQCLVTTACHSGQYIEFAILKHAHFLLCCQSVDGPSGHHDGRYDQVEHKLEGELHGLLGNKKGSLGNSLMPRGWSLPCTQLKLRLVSLLHTQLNCLRGATPVSSDALGSCSVVQILISISIILLNYIASLSIITSLAPHFQNLLQAGQVSWSG